MQFLVVRRVRFRISCVNTLLKTCSETFDDFINNVDQDPRFNHDNDEDGGLVDIDDL
jgi:hypothetical protein